MKPIKNEPDLRTAEEWKAWARAKIKNEPRLLTETEINEMELGDCIEFEPGNPLLQKIVVDKKSNFVEEYLK